MVGLSLPSLLLPFGRKQLVLGFRIHLYLTLTSWLLLVLHSRSPQNLLIFLIISLLVLVACGWINPRLVVSSRQKSRLKAITQAISTWGGLVSVSSILAFQPLSFSNDLSASNPSQWEMSATPLGGYAARTVLAALPVKASPTKGFDRSVALLSVGEEWQPESTADLVVYETDVTQPVPEANELRQYDLHVAMMYDRTQRWCAERDFRRVLWWNYAAAGGDLDLGELRISCRQAKRAVRRYDLQAPEDGFAVDVPPRRRQDWREFVERSHPLPTGEVVER